MNNFINNNTRPAFDRSICCTFFGSWYEVIRQMETEEDRKSLAYMMLKALLEYGLYGVEPDEETYTNDLKTILVFWPSFRTEIDNNIKRRKQGFAPELPNPNHEKVIEYIVKHPDASLRETAEQTGVGKSTVERVKNSYAERIANEQTGNQQLSKNTRSAVNSPLTQGLAWGNQAVNDMEDDDDEVPF